MNAREIVVEMMMSLERIGSEIIKKYRLNAQHSEETGVHSRSHDERFFAEPNNVDTIRKAYHQWGIATHSYMALMYKNEALRMMTEWTNFREIEDRLQEKIDNNTKGDLLELALILHDVGKFACRYLKWHNGKLIYKFSEHEKASGIIIRKDLADRLMEMGLTSDEVEYVAVLAERHYELARVRVESNGGFTWEMVNSENVLEKLELIRQENSASDIEIGLMFLADSLAKTKYHCFSPEEAEEIVASGQVDPPEHAPAVRQQPLKIKLAEKYFSLFE